MAYVTPITLFIFAAISVALALAISRNNSNTQGKLSILGILCSSLASFAYGFELLSPSLETKLFWVVIRYTGLTFFSLFLALNTMLFLRLRNRLRRSIIVLVSIIPILTVILLAFYPYSTLVYQNAWVDTSGIVPMLKKTTGPLYWIDQAFIILFLLGMSVSVLWYSRRGSSLNRRQSYIISGGLLLPALTEIIYLSGGRIQGIFNPFFLAYFPCAVLIWYGIQRYHLANIRPIAGSTLLEQMQDGILVIDERGTIIDINPAALKYLDSNTSSMLGKHIQSVAPSILAILVKHGASSNLTSVIHLDDIPVQVNISPVEVRKGEYTGNLIILRDISDRVEAENLKSAEIQRQSAWSERQKIARTLHDSITQYLNSLVFLSSSANQRLEQEKYDQLAPIITHISTSAKTAVQEMRELIHELQLESPSEFSLINAMNERIHLIGAQSDIKIKLDTPTAIHLVSYQQRELFYIILEALNNIMQHANAHNVLVRLMQKDITFTAEINDDGSGFTPEKTRPGGMGLSNIRERSRQLGAHLTIDSAPGTGTRIFIELPTGSERGPRDKNNLDR